MNTPELRAITESAVGPLERALAKECLTHFLGPELQLRYSLCLVASTALKKHLKRRYDMTTETVIKDLPIPADVAGGHTFSHVVLRYESNTIDPTYSQFMSYVGLRTYDAFNHPELASLYPPSKIAVIPDNTHEEFASTMAARMYIATPWLTNLERDTPKLHLPDGLFMGAPFATIDDFTQAVWRPDDWMPYVTEDVDYLTDAIVTDMEHDN